MMNMNLATEQTSDPAQTRASSSWGLIAIAVVFFLTVGVTGGLIIWKNSLQKQMNEKEAAYQEKYDQLVKEKRNRDVVDFQNRITMANELIKEKNIALDSLQFVEKSMVAGVYLTNYKNDKKNGTLILEGVADNYETVAKQTLSFKTSDYFSSVDATKVGLSDKGEIIFSMEMKIK